MASSGNQASAEADDLQVEAAKELARRRAVVEGAFDHAGEMEAPDVADPGFTHAVLHMANASLRPACASAAVRVLGMFSSREEALAHGGFVAGEMRDCDVHLMPIGRWALVPASHERLSDAEYSASKIDAIIAAAARTKRRRTEDFESNRSKQQTGAIEERAEPAAAEQDAEPIATPLSQRRGGTAPCRPCPASCQLAGQRFVVFSYMCDECEGEPALCLHAAFDSGEDARAFAKCVGGRMPDANVDVAEMYQWLHIDEAALPESVEEEYRDGELDRIMKSRKRQNAAAKRVREKHESGEKVDQFVIADALKAEDALQRTLTSGA